jgi:hypothetical protein
MQYENTNGTPALIAMWSRAHRDLVAYIAQAPSEVERRAAVGRLHKVERKLRELRQLVRSAAA